jgi:hypothetical protein
MQKFNYVKVNSHVVADVRGRRFLIEPSLPRSIATRPLLLDGKRIEVKQTVNGLSVEDFNLQVGVELDGVLGANLSSEFVVNILPRERAIVLDQALTDFPINVDIDNLGGEALMEVSIGGKRMRARLGLEHKLSLIRYDLVKSCKPVDRETVMFRCIGPLDVDVYTLPLIIGQRAIHMRFGVMPAEMAESLELANVQATLGSGLLEHFALSLAMEEGVLSLDPLH